jgi:hypothetical protein
MTALLHASHAVSGNAELAIAGVFIVIALTLLVWPGRPAGASKTRQRRRQTNG